MSTYMLRCSMAAASLIRGGEIPIEVSYQEVRGVGTKYVCQLIGFLVNTAAGTTKELGLLRARLELFFHKFGMVASTHRMSSAIIVAVPLAFAWAKKIGLYP